MPSARTIRSPSTGMRRTFKAKEWRLVIVQQDEDEARGVSLAIGQKCAPEVHYVEHAEVAA